MLSWEEIPTLAPMMRERAWVEVDLAALTHNVRQIRQLLTPQTDLMAVVKADAYGHGAVVMAKTAIKAGASWLGVATIPEGIELRKAGITAPILLLGATNTPDQVQAIAHWQLQPTVGTCKQAMVFAEALGSGDQPLPVHINVDTGMSRIGSSWPQALDVVQLVHQLPQLQLDSIYSHFATADNPDPTIMQMQVSRFKSAIAQIRAAGIPIPRLHLANSAATLLDPDLHYNLVRVGLAIYGLYPSPHLSDRAMLRPVLQVKARITQVKTIPAGTGVSYGHKFLTSKETQIAVVGIGYADGVPRNLSNHMDVLIQGQRVPQIGAITMDQLMLDVSAAPKVQAGDIVTLLGTDRDQSISADDWATQLGTISWEILCGFQHRLPRLAINQPSEDICSTCSL